MKYSYSGNETRFRLPVTYDWNEFRILLLSSETDDESTQILKCDRQLKRSTVLPLTIIFQSLYRPEIYSFD